MKTYYVVEDREKNGKWAQCSTYDTQQEAIDRLRYEAQSIAHNAGEQYIPEPDTLIFLNNHRLKTLNGYEMRIDPVEVSD